MISQAELALRDVAQLMIAVSDNHATGVVLGRVFANANYTSQELVHLVLDSGPN